MNAYYDICSKLRFLLKMQRDYFSFQLARDDCRINIPDKRNLRIFFSYNMKSPIEQRLKNLL